MQAKFRTTGPLMAAYLAAAGAAYLALTASECKHTTEIVPFVAESGDKCLDKIDNDQDDDIDCADADCEIVCAVTLHIDPVPPIIKSDTLDLKGSVHNATSVTVLSVLPKGIASPPAVSGETWSTHLTNLDQRGGYTVIVAASKDGRKSADTVNFTRGD